MTRKPQNQQPKVQPPRWADKLLEWFIAPHLLEFVQGDLHEVFYKQVETNGLSRARQGYISAVLHCLTPFFYKRKATSKYPNPSLTDMLQSYFTTARRNLAKNKMYTAINVFGLALGMACALMIGLWVQDELSYNRFITDAENVFFVRTNSTNRNTGEIGTGEVTPGPLQDALSKDIPEVAAATKVNAWAELLVKVGEKSAKEKGYYATNDFFGVFELPVLKGNPRTALAQTNQIVITEKMADKYFPNTEALGKTLQLNNEKFYVVGAVLKDLPDNSTLKFAWVVNWKEQEQPWQKTWGNSSFLTYVRLRQNTTQAQAEQSMKGIYKHYTDKDNTTVPILQPITDVYLYGEYKMGKPVGGRIEYVRVFSVVAAFLLLIACINFMNLATARSATRAKEVGVRKVVGALRSSLIGQFLSESVLTSVLAVVLALAGVWLALPGFNQLFGKQLALNLASPAIWAGIIALTMLTGLLAGSYPALFLSALRPIAILKGKIQFGNGPALFRKILVTFQFSLSVFLIVGMLAVSKQMQYLRTKNLGLDRNNVIYLTLEGNFAKPENMEAFRQEVIRQPAVASATTTAMLPVNIQATSGDLSWPGKDPSLETNVTAMTVGADFVKTMNIKLVDGRDFRAGSAADSSAYLINEATARLMGEKNPVGKEIKFWKGTGRVIGLMKDFHMISLHQAITPLVLTYIPENSGYLLVKTQTGKTEQALAELKNIAKRFNPDYPFDYHFLDDEYENLYRSEQQVNTLVNYFGVLAILISCLGLFGLAAFTAEQRTKEIGVRKVLGASSANIVGLLSSDFLKLILIALILASPLAWWALSSWLGTFAYHTGLSWWIFAISGVVTTSIALLTVSSQAIKAAWLNPVSALRTE
ncbi:ABC transporter permease [Dyadobacter chenhuakuii]|uniref:ABC transporter permease n=1 Tax=Dyadobacter chenhuakuii TaxID=2909339 RepID=A0A9X1QGG0_9BACT|nr:ABC transporter permease [Dyadobacter chenhuakuii]MCF2501270.1 ABC transporter permease [Dyadobacter chenhuakuii]